MWLNYAISNNSFQDGVDTSSSGGVTVTTGSANTKGSYTQIISSTERETNLAIISITSSTVNRTILADIAIGAASSEVVIIPNLRYSSRNILQKYVIPINIPKGVRVSARAQDLVGSIEAYISVHLVSFSNSGSSGFSHCDHLGVNTSDSGATQIDAGGTAYTYGSYAEIISSTARDYKAILPVITGADTAQTVDRFRVNVAIGASSSEQIIMPDLWAKTHNSEIEPSRFPYPAFCNIPAGTRLSANCMSTNNASGNRELDISLLVFS